MHGNSDGDANGTGPRLRVAYCAIAYGMRTTLRLTAFAALLAASLGSTAQEDHPEEGYIHLVKINGIITGATHDIIKSAREQAEKYKATALIIVLDTPGGLVDATREIVKEQLNAKVPVVVYVGPKGARAGSAGVFITLAAHVAAMAPSTNIGAAHPIGIGTPDFLRRRGDDDDDSADDNDEKREKKKAKKGDKEKKDSFIFKSDQEHLARKIENDTVAWAVGIAKERGRNVEWARQAVLESVSITSDEALAKNVIDLIAEDRAALLKALDGRQVTTAAGEVVIHTEGARVVEQLISLRQKLEGFLSNPTILGILGLIMMLGFYAEVNNPGLIVPAAIGVAAMIALLVGTQLVSLNALGFLFIALGFVLFFLEIKVVSYGLLTVGGIASIIAGFYLLVDKLSFAAPPVDWALLAPILSGVILVVVGVTYLAFKSQTSKAPAADLSDMVGQVGTARSDLDPEGKVWFLGALWSASATETVRKGEEVRIVATKGLRLTVEPVSKQTATQTATKTEGDTT